MSNIRTELLLEVFIKRKRLTMMRYSFVVRKTSIRVLLQMIAHKNLELEQLDIKTIFLHGELDKEIYIKPNGFQVPKKE